MRHPAHAAAFDVVVVGAGISGLSVARQLIDAGCTCKVLERQGRVGGRLLTRRGTVGPLDLGATWFWPGEQRVAALIDDLGVGTHAQHIAGDALYHVPGGAQRIAGNPIDVAAGRFTAGAATVAERLAAHLGEAVSLGEPVHHIGHDGPLLRVSHASGTVTSRHVVLALPPSTAVEQIDFRPALPDDLHALAASTPVWMGNIAKVVAVYSEPFWRREGLAGAAISHIGPLREIHDMSGPDGDPAALFGFAPLAPHAPTPTTREVVGQLVELFGLAAAAPVEVIAKDWRADARIVPPGATPGAATGSYAHPLYQQPTGDGRIHWASTETAPTSPGHIEGALAAAARAARAITGQTATTTPSASARSQGEQ